MPTAGVQPAATIGLTDRELSLVREALRYRKADLVGMHRLCLRVGAAAECHGFADRIVEIDIVRLKLGDDAGAEEGQTT